MKHLFVIIITFFFQITFLYPKNNNHNKKSKIEIKLCVANDQKYFLKDDKVLLKIWVINDSYMPIIFKYDCVSLYLSKNNMFTLIIKHNNSEYMLFSPEGKCVLYKTKVLIKGNPILITKSFSFNNLIVKKSKSSFNKTDNTNYGTYSLQILYQFPKDTIFSNIIELEYKEN